MDRRTIIAVLLIMAVLIGDQYIMSRWGRHKQPARPTTGQDSTGVASTPAVTPPQSSTSTPATSVPPRSANGAAAIVSTSGPRVAAAPIVERELKSSLATATFSSRGGTISQW